MSPRVLLRLIIVMIIFSTLAVAYLRSRRAAAASTPPAEAQRYCLAPEHGGLGVPCEWARRQYDI